MSKRNYAEVYITRAVMQQKPEMLGGCDKCGHGVFDGDGWVTADQPEGGYSHASCVSAAYNRGLRDGYQESLRMLREATKVMKRGAA